MLLVAPLAAYVVACDWIGTTPAVRSWRLSAAAAAQSMHVGLNRLIAVSNEQNEEARNEVK
jgi:hypothetical protein